MNKSGLLTSYDIKNIELALASSPFFKEINYEEFDLWIYEKWRNDGKLREGGRWAVNITIKVHWFAFLFRKNYEKNIRKIARNNIHSCIEIRKIELKL